MKKLLFTMALSTLAFSAIASELIHAESQIVTLEGTFAKVQRSNKTNDDRAEIKRCGSSYSVLLLDKPIQISIPSQESEVRTEVTVQYIRTWGNVDTKATEGNRVQVRGVIGEELLGLCSPGLAIQESSFYPDAK